jgi:hypothetical protein
VQGRSAADFDARVSEGVMAKPASGKSESDELPDDIRQRVLQDFGPELADEVYRYLLDRVPDGLPNGTRPRHLRCILYLAKGDRTILDRYIALCLQDTRDVMLQAEYERESAAGLARMRDFGKPFAQSQIPVREGGGEVKGKP